MAEANQQSSQQTTMYDWIGGEQGVRKLVDRFYEIMDQDEQAKTIRAMHKQDLSEIKNGLFEYLSGWLGGPPLYIMKHGSPCITKPHAPFKIDQAASDAWMHCITKAMEDVAIEEKYRKMLTPAFQRMCDTLMNS
ncbi:MAG: hemoglobin [Cycloclasticus sp.]|jgi:hemoglobin|tara:strand:+ start:357 stop:761 length:405 start_codon:yes stop_codon:yes gene_type:complete